MRDTTTRARPRPIADLAAAVGFLTMLPAGRWDEACPPRAVGWYGWVGWLIGAPVAGVAWLLLRFVMPARPMLTLLLGVLIVGVWALLTRALHWDGLADTFDAIWGGSGPQRRLEIMRDSRIGSFGAVAILFTALVEVVAVAALVEVGALWVLVMAAVIARGAASAAAWTMPAARREGLGLTAMGDPGPYDVIVTAAACLVLLVFAPFAPAPFFAVLAMGVTAAFAVPRLLARGVGGMTGDLFGATVLLVEAIVLLTGALLT